MSRPAKSLVRHGMPSCYRYGCREPRCTAAARRRSVRLRQDQYRGIRQNVAIGPARAHVMRLVFTGMSSHDIAAKAGIDHTTVNLIRRGTVAKIRRSVADAVLGISVPEKPVVSNPRTKVPAAGTIRRLQALSVRGFPLRVLADGMEAPIHTVARIRAGDRTSVTIATHLAAVALYEQLWRADPVDRGVATDRAASAATYARSHGWAPSGCWDEDTINDPDAFPDWTGHCGTPSGWLLHRIAGEKPCGPCVPHSFTIEAGRGASRAVAELAPGALLALADAGRTHAEVALLLGLTEHNIAYAHGVIRQNTLEEAA